MLKFYEKADVILFHGDCIDVLNKSTPESVDIIFADPPYMLSNGGITCHAGKVVSVNKAKHTFNYDIMKNADWDYDFIKKTQKQMRSVWAIGTPKNYEKQFGKHPTQKPLELLRRIILASTNKGDLILDPFTGSSTTGIMALELDRQFIGIDKETEYLELSVKRFEQTFSKKERTKWL